jgi:hypothetical protein
LDNGGVFTFLQSPGSTFTQVLGLNNDDEIVGFYTDAGGNNHGFLYNIARATDQALLLLGTGLLGLGGIRRGIAKPRNSATK